MATNATQNMRSARTDLPRPSRRDQTSRLPSKSPVSSSIPRPGASPVTGASTHFGLRSTSNGKSGNTSYQNNGGNGAALNVVRPSLNIPYTTPSPASTTSRPRTSGDTLEPSPETEATPTPSLISGSSVSSRDSPRSNVLRRKPSVIAQYASQRKKAEQEASFAQSLIHRIEIPRAGSAHIAQTEGSRPSEEIQRMRTPSNNTSNEPSEAIYGADGHLLSRRTPLSETSTTPSLTYSSSPSQFSHTTTATSLTSASPMTSSSPFFGMKPFVTTPRKTSTPTTEPLGHPFFRQTNKSGTVSTTNLSRPSTSNQPAKPTKHAEEAYDQRTTPMTTSPAKAAKSPAVHPPELAYLSAASTSRTTSEAPPRPSRDGMPSLHDQRKARPVVQSNLPKLDTNQHRRRSSATFSANEALSTSRSPAVLRKTPISARTATPDKARIDQSGSQLSLQSMNESAVTDDEAPSAKTPDTATRHKSRFGFFSRKPKPDSSEGSKPARKGPAAGTGHEGYGKHSARNRSGSSTSNASGAAYRPADRRKSSGASSKVSDLDDFLSQRLAPVYLRGEGRDGEAQGRTSGSTFDEQPPIFTPAMSSPETAHTSLSSAELPKPLIITEDALSRGRPSTDSSLRPPVSVASRSPSRKRLAKPRPTPKQVTDKQIDTASKTSNSSVQQNAPRPSTQSSRPKMEETPALKTKKSHWSLFPKTQKDTKPVAKRSFFSRSKPAEPTEAQQAEPGSRDSLSMPTSVPAHYLPVEINEQVDPEDLDMIMQEAAAAVNNGSDDGTDFEDLDDEVVVSFDANGTKRRSKRMSQLSQPTGAALGKQESQSTSTSSESHVSVGEAEQVPIIKQSRLAPVGRIPQVTSRADNARRPTALSFSRPFAQASPKPDVQSPPASATLSLFPPGVQHSQKSSASSGASALPRTSSECTNGASIPALALDTKMRDLASAPFFNPSPRKNSDVSYTSSSNTTYYPTAATIAHGPGRNSHASTDETWPEYDDLIDHVLTPSPSGSERQSKQYFDSTQRLARAALPKLGTVESFSKPPESSAMPPTKASVMVDGPSEPVGVIAAALRDTPSMCTLRSTRSNSLCNSFQSKESVPRSLKHKRSNSLPTNAVTTQPGAKQSSDSVYDPITQENPFMFRYRVLMTSKWLSFGRLLFSPIHHELGNPDDRVLVIDGLGNRDWSYYCAVSYPQTQIYSLGPSASTTTDGRASLGNSFGTLPNYTHFSYTTPGTDFPFPKGFFAAVVYRFPVAHSDAVARCMVSECKRVLRPGGYLEISTVDLDLSNMGTLCRRGVRELKLKMREAAPTVSLKPASDHLQGLIGRRGFENLNRGVIGVPAAGVIGSSRENSQDGEEVDIGRLATDNSKEGDDHITKMVAQVGRWWYSQSYETGILPNGDFSKSMWSNRALLKECEELNTTFKVLICYAQKPNCAKRRTVSV